MKKNNWSSIMHDIAILIALVMALSVVAGIMLFAPEAESITYEQIESVIEEPRIIGSVSDNERILNEVNLIDAFVYDVRNSTEEPIVINGRNYTALIRDSSIRLYSRSNFNIQWVFSINRNSVTLKYHTGTYFKDSEAIYYIDRDGEGTFVRWGHRSANWLNGYDRGFDILKDLDIIN